jgi:Phasin protein
MSSTEQGKPGGKSGRRNRKGERGKKAKPQASQAPVQLQSAVPDQPPEPKSERVEQPEAGQQPPVHALVDALDESPEVPSAEVPMPKAAAPPAATPEIPTPQVPTPQVPTPQVPTPEAAAPEIPPTAAPSPTEPAPVSLQTIANAYRDYTRKSLEAFGSYVEQLSGARSLDKALTLQTEFVKKAYETSVAESQRICELHNRLARQTLQPLQGAVSKAPDTDGKS